MNDYIKEFVWDKLVVEGYKALTACKPTPVGFYPAGLMGERLGKTEIVDEGNCGGAYVILWDSRSDFVKWMKKNKPEEISKNMGKGYVLSCHSCYGNYRGQSAERYEACAEAVAKILQDSGIKCSVRAYLT